MIYMFSRMYVLYKADRRGESPKYRISNTKRIALDFPASEGMTGAILVFILK